MPTLDKIVIWVTPSGNTRITNFIAETFQGLKKNNPALTEEMFVSDETAKILAARAEYKTFRPFVKSKTELKQIILNHPQGHIERIRIKPDGTLYIDPAVKLPWEKTRDKRTVLLGKLKALGLDDDEIRYITNRRMQ